MILLVWFFILNFKIGVFGITSNVEVQRYDGYDNNLINHNWGSVRSHLYRNHPPNYSDQISQINDSLPSARQISNILFDGEAGKSNSKNLTVAVPFFAQFVAYEIMNINLPSCPLEAMKTPIPECDKIYDKDCQRRIKSLKFLRSSYDSQTGNGINSPRQQINHATSWIDGSFIYGTTEARQGFLRSFKNGIFSEGLPGYPPLNTENIPNDNPAPPQVGRILDYRRLFMLGDQRVNENPGLLTFSIIFFRWHNYLARQMSKDHPDWKDEEIFQVTRRFVIATLQNIVVNEFVPALIGVNLSSYTNYKANEMPSVSHAFSAAAFQFPLTLMPPAMLLRRRGRRCEFRDETLRICQNWWNSQYVIKKFSVDDVALGMITQIAESMDMTIVDDVRNFFYGPMHFSRLDAVSATIMKGRDFGLGSYNTVRKIFGLAPITWETINADFYKKYPEKIEKLRELYGGDINSLDTYVGGMLEAGENGPGELFIEIIKDQFERIRDGDRFWFENRLNGIFTNDEIEQIRNITLRDIIKSTTDISEDMLQNDVFFFHHGDPCPQPFQVNNSGLEPCVPLIQTSYWIDDGVSYLFILICLGSIPIVCYGIGFYIGQTRLGFIDPDIKLKLKNEEKKKEKADKTYKVDCLEWIHENYIRHAQVEIEKSTFCIKKRRSGKILKKIVFDENQTIEIVHSIPNTSSSRYGPGPFVSISPSPNKFHLILLSNAITKERRQDRLDHFFREAYARAFNANELSDAEIDYDPNNDILKETISREELASAMGMKDDDIFVRRMFAMTARHNEDTMSFEEFLTVLRQFVNAPQSEKFRYLFKMCDLDGTNRIRRNDFIEMIRSIKKTVGVRLTIDEQTRLIDAILAKSGVNTDSDFVSREEFEALFTEISTKQPVLEPIFKRKYHETIDEAISLKSFGVVQRFPFIENSVSKRIVHRIISFIETHRQHLFILFSFFAANLVVFFNGYWHYNFMTQHGFGRQVMGMGLPIARGSGAGISFCMAVILLTVCRNVMTLFRETFVGQFVPFDSAIIFHKIVAYTCAFWSITHTIGHCINFYHISTQSPTGLNCLFREAVFKSDPLPSISFWFFRTITGLTGIALVIVMSIMYVFSMPSFIQKAYHAFHFTHLLFIAFYALTFLHGFPKLLDTPKFLYFVFIPILIFLIDSIMGWMKSYIKLSIVKAEILPSDIVFIEFERPRTFLYRSGQWCRISSPSFSSIFNESHPFSLASSPLDNDTIKLYIKAIGPWTYKLRSAIRQSQAYCTPYPLIHLKGPYGDGNQEWMNYEVAIMVGGGIGVTPYASTLTDLVHPKSNDSHHRVMCKKVYFLWVCPSHKNYEWFVDVLKNVEKQDRNGILETHIFITQLFHKFDLRTTMLYICEKHFRGTHEGMSMFTGLHAQNHFGRPDFNAFFKFIQTKHREQSEIGVFSCGPVALNEKIGEGCAQANRQRDAPSFSHRFETF